MKTLLPPGWPRPKGYANGIAARGTTVYVAGQVGWDPEGNFVGERLCEQFRQCLVNTVAVLAEAGAGPEHVVRMTWYITDKREYLQDIAEIGAHYREIMGKNFPAMAMVEVSALIEDAAKIEVESTAVLPDA